MAFNDECRYGKIARATGTNFVDYESDNWPQTKVLTNAGLPQVKFLITWIIIAAQRVHILVAQPQTSCCHRFDLFC